MSNISPDEPITTRNVLRHLTEGWNDLQTFLASADEGQLTSLTDAVGWTVRDHLVHLAVWEAGIVALLEGRSRIAAMGLDQATWNSGDADVINEAIRQHYQPASLADVVNLLRQTHEQLVQKVASISDADLSRPYRDFQPDSEHTDPVVGWIVGNSFGHIYEHKPWMAAILNQG